MTHHPPLFRCDGLCSKHCINNHVGFPRYFDLNTEGCDFLVAYFILRNQWTRNYIAKHFYGNCVDQWNAHGERNNKVMISTRWGLVHSSLGLEWECTVTVFSATAESYRLQMSNFHCHEHCCCHF